MSIDFFVCFVLCYLYKIFCTKLLAIMENSTFVGRLGGAEKLFQWLNDTPVQQV